MITSPQLKRDLKYRSFPMRVCRDLLWYISLCATDWPQKINDDMTETSDANIQMRG